MLIFIFIWLIFTLQIDFNFLLTPTLSQMSKFDLKEPIQNTPHLKYEANHAHVLIPPTNPNLPIILCVSKSLWKIIPKVQLQVTKL